MIRDVDEEADEEGDKGDDEPFHGFGAEAALSDRFKEGKGDVASIENGDGEEVDEAEIETDNGHPEKCLFCTDLPTLMDDMDNANGSTDVFGIEIAREKTGESAISIFKNTAELLKRPWIVNNRAIF